MAFRRNTDTRNEDATLTLLNAAHDVRHAADDIDDVEAALGELFDSVPETAGWVLEAARNSGFEIHEGESGSFAVLYQGAVEATVIERMSRGVLINPYRLRQLEWLLRAAAKVGEGK